MYISSDFVRRFDCTQYITKCFYILQVNQVDEYMRYRKLPQELKQRVHEYYYHRYRGQLFNEEAILKELSFPLEEVRSTELMSANMITCKCWCMFMTTVCTYELYAYIYHSWLYVQVTCLLCHLYNV